MMITAVIISALLFLIYASYNINSNVYMRVFCKKHTRKKVVAITFDDGPAGLETARVLAVLKEYNIAACFFCIGNKIEGNEALLQQMVSEGHLLGNHSYTHSTLFPLYNLHKMKEDLLACQREIERASSQKTNLFRPPFGVTNPTIAKAVKQLGYIPIGWNIRTLDTLQHSPEKIVRYVQRKLRPGSVILLHDRMPQSNLLLKQIIELIIKEGYSIVRLDGLI
ncbi:polysaccharide deacetylase family protein [Bacteroides ihuae]|uniref:polysaccharide deacetylase family protein n=1 Tax=Bacteroides ihuae TaxID=1852362 RepID=UPI0008D9F994|nr:polysaccharide deacetylase family protein [Bacteroides ihuae]